MRDGSDGARSRRFQSLMDLDGLIEPRLLLDPEARDRVVDKQLS